MGRGIRGIWGVLGSPGSVEALARCWGFVFGLWPGWLNEWNDRRLAGEAGYCVTRTPLEV